MSKKRNFHYIIIGSGPAGSAAALKLAKAGKRVALIEARYFGGSNLNTRDVPYGLALDFSHHYAKTLSYPELKNQGFTFNFPTIAARQLSTIIEAGGNNKKFYEDAGIICLSGYANFLDKHTVAINHQKFTADYFILATGSTLKISEISGTETIEFLTPETAIKSHRLPQVIAIVGAGSTGCEIAEYYAELGVKTILLETSSRLLPREDQDVSDVLATYFTRKLGITLLLNSKVVAIGQDSYSKYLIFNSENSEKMVRVDQIVLATGSQPFLDYGLANAGVKYKNTGITVNKQFQTSTKHIYAIGDCLGQESSTERAAYEGSLLATNLINKTKNTPNYKGTPRITNTYPEVATIGLTEDDLSRRDRKFKKLIIKLDDLTASKIYHFDYGFIKILVDKNNHLLGATIVAPHAGLMIAELSLILRHNLSLVELASTPHLVNSFNYGIQLAAKSLLKKRR